MMMVMNDDEDGADDVDDAEDEEEEEEEEEEEKDGDAAIGSMRFPTELADIILKPE